MTLTEAKYWWAIALELADEEQRAKKKAERENAVKRRR
jgi:hypothetical protein